MRSNGNIPKSVAVLEVGGMDDGVQHLAERVDQDMTLLASDLLARVVGVRIELVSRSSRLTLT